MEGILQLHTSSSIHVKYAWVIVLEGCTLLGTGILRAMCTLVYSCGREGGRFSSFIKLAVRYHCRIHGFCDRLCTFLNDVIDVGSLIFLPECSSIWRNGPFGHRGGFFSFKISLIARYSSAAAAAAKFGLFLGTLFIFLYQIRHYPCLPEVWPEDDLACCLNLPHITKRAVK